ncbi:MAG: copper amine oxidase N-terminal domain-containing protein [Armatimonadota bacterium]
MTRLSAVFTLFILLATAAFAQAPAAQMRNGSMFVPLRYIAEWLGATVDYGGQPRQITISLDNRTIVLQPGKKVGTSNGAQITLTSPPYISQGTTFVPLRFVSEGLGASVAWDGATRKATVTHPNSGNTLAFTAPSQVRRPQATTSGPTVYITRTGAKYHSAGCQYLRRSCIPISLSEAKAQGYTPCSRCSPPR